VQINNFYRAGFSHTHYHLHPGSNYSYPGNNYSYSNNGSNPTNYGANYGANYGNNNANNEGNNNASNPNVFHAGGAGGTGGTTAGDSYNAGGGTVVLVSGSKPLPSGLTTSAAAGTGGSGTATAGTILTIFNITAGNTAP